MYVFNAYTHVYTFPCTQKESCTCKKLLDKGVEILQEEKIPIKSSDGIPNNLARKRSGPEDSIDAAKDDDVSGKRARSSPNVLEESSKELDHRASKKDDDNGPVQQLVAMFGALVAQGEKAVGSLEILISSISADLLAEVVMANMRYLPTGHPQAGDNESLVNMTVIGSDSRAKYPSSFLANVLSLSSSFPPIAAQMNADHSVSKDSLVRVSSIHLQTFLLFSFSLA